MPPLESTPGFRWCWQRLLGAIVIPLAAAAAIAEIVYQFYR